MTISSVGDFSTTAASNTDIDGINIAENCPAAGINNAIRTLMAFIKTAFATVAEVLTGTATAKFLTPSNLFGAAAWFSLTDGATISVDQNSGLNFTVTLGGNRAIANMSNAKAGSGGFFEIIQDGTGSRTLTWGSNYKWPGGTAPTLSTAAGSIDMVAYVVKSSSIVRCSIVKGFTA